MNINLLVDYLFEFIGSDSEVEEAWLSKIKEYYNEGGSLTELTDRNGWQLIHIAALNGMDSVVEWLVHNGVDVDSRDDRGCTPLMYAFDLDIDGAVQHGKEIDFSHSKNLIRLGADQNVVNNEGRSLESTASVYGKKAYSIFEANFRSKQNTRKPT